ncbi:response regulator transcription factor [Alkalibacterium iburiense]|uniref:Response regulator transcription factor n=1 Tax=Alkalibacterium iburiense TaxID=290589 RepID=A0ABN0XTI1_9LACT
MIKVYIAEDQKMLNSALTSLLQLEESLEVVGTALDGEEALKGILEYQPDVAILDIEMPKMTGLDVAEAIHSTDTKVIILTTFARQSYFETAVKHQVQGYLLKDSPTDKLTETIYAVMNGETIYDPALVRHVLRKEKNPLTEREIEVLQCLSEGIPTQAIAEKVFLSQGTVRNYISSILSKTGARSRIEAVNVARKHQWMNE